MATKTITVTTCDLPHPSETEGFPVTVTTPDGTWEVDLCTEHAAALLDVVAAGRRQGRTRRKAKV